MWELTAYSSPPEPLTVFRGPTPKLRGGKSLRRGGEGGGEEGEFVLCPRKKKEKSAPTPKQISADG